MQSHACAETKRLGGSWLTFARPRRNHLCRFVLRSLTGFRRGAGVKFWLSPLTCFVALTTLSHYRARVWLQVSLKLHHRSTRNFRTNIRTTKMCPAMQYCDVITNPRWRTAAILKIAKSPYLSEKSSDRFFGHNSSTDSLISAKFCMRKQNGMSIRAAWQKLQICSIQDGGRPPF